MKPVRQFQCETCGKIGSEHVIADHEERCREDQQRRIAVEAARQRKENDATENALYFAQEDAALVLLAKAGLDKAALERAESVYSANVSYDPDCSIWHTAIYKKMVEAARASEGTWQP